MSARGTIAASLASLGVLAVGWQAGAHAWAGTTAAPAGSGQATTASGQAGGQVGQVGQSGTGSQAGQPGTGGQVGSSGTSGQPGAGFGGRGAPPGGRGGSAGGSSGAATSKLTVPAGASGTFTGATASNRWGSVAVTVTLQSGRITDVQASIDDLGNGHSSQINAYAVPVLKQQVLAVASGGTVASVSGATYTSSAYLTSLQSALDQAK